VKNVHISISPYSWAIPANNILIFNNIKAFGENKFGNLEVTALPLHRNTLNINNIIIFI